MIADATAKLGTVDILVNNAGIQFVSPIEDFPPEKWDMIIAINLVFRLPYDPRRGSGHEGAEMGPHRQHRLGPFARRLAVQVGLRVGQARPRRPHQDGRARTRDLRRHLQLHLARLRLDAAGREPDPRHDEGAQYDARAGHQRRDASRPADQAVRHRRPGRLARRLSLLGRGGADHRRRTSRSTAAGRRREQDASETARAPRNQ